MKKKVKYIGLLLLVIFSFYYTNVVSSVIINNSQMMRKIKSGASLVETKAVNAEIDGNYIVPGLFGQKVNNKASYSVMKENNTFATDLYVFDEVLPATSLANNKNLIINHGNTLKEEVSIIVKDNMDIISYAIENKILINRLVSKDTFVKTYNYLQINNDDVCYEDVEKKLDSIEGNKNLCVINDKIKDLCEDYEKYLIKPNVIVNKNESHLFESIASGDIILFSDDVSVSVFKIIVSKISFHNLKIVYLDELISEKRS